MRYETPMLSGPMELYETPMLVDIDEAAAQDLADAESGCSTLGIGFCSPIIEY